MYYKHVYKTPDDFSDLIMISDGEMLIELYFKGDMDEKRREKSKWNDACDDIDQEICSYTRSEFDDAIRWLNIYFEGKEPDFRPAYKINGATSFRKEVIGAMMDIPYGKSSTYSSIAKAMRFRTSICQSVSFRCS